MNKKALILLISIVPSLTLAEFDFFNRTGKIAKLKHDLQVTQKVLQNKEDALQGTEKIIKGLRKELSNKVHENEQLKRQKEELQANICVEKSNNTPYYLLSAAIGAVVFEVFRRLYNREE